MVIINVEFKLVNGVNEDESASKVVVCFLSRITDPPLLYFMSLQGKFIYF